MRGGGQQEARQAEVADLDRAARVAEDVLSLDVSVEDAERVHVREPLAHLHQDRPDGILRQIAGAGAVRHIAGTGRDERGDARAQVAAVKELHQYAERVLVDKGLLVGHDVGV